MKRCAIYTRKSSDEGLEQGFNSLDAQREACEAYVLSQVGEGWSASPTGYDDGGFSGGSMERPGLQALLADIRAGKVDIVVVYKIDRLTRSLADFARIVETFDKHEVSFVSVTQAFNTTSSMGRLTLNVLLSFAQFEREVTGERIRDKIAASKAKGMWMGGLAPLGYDLPKDGTRTLSINLTEAEIVRSIFARYLELGSVYKLIDDLEARGIRSKARVTAKGKELGGGVFSRGAMFHLLQNRVYVSDIMHKGERFDGQHDGIVPTEMFDAVQAMIASHRRERGAIRQAANFLVGKFFDADGRRMTPSHSRGASGRRYCYYVASPTSQAAVKRVQANAIEALLRQRLTRLMPDVADPLDCISRVTVDEDLAMIELPARHRRSIRRLLADDEHLVDHPSDPNLVVLHLAANFAGRNGRTRIRFASIEAHRRDPVLIKALRAAHDMVTSTRTGVPIIDQVPGPRYQRRLIRLTFLAPEIQCAILAGRQPANLRLEDLIRHPMPLDWADQRRWIERLAG